MEPIILASSSPRRQEILKSLKIPFRVLLPNIDETISSAVKAEEVPELFAREKVTTVLKSIPNEQMVPWILGADTIITLGNEVLGKPENLEQAHEYLNKIQGKSHYVITAIALYNGKKRKTTSRVCKTKVTFAPMTEDEINWYLDTGEWHGVAGGYRIQGAASTFITKIEGSYSGVIGLPIYELFDILKEQGYSILN